MGVAFSPDSSLLASASLDGSLAVWRVQTREQLVLFRAPSKACCCVAFSPVTTPPCGRGPTEARTSACGSTVVPQSGHGSVNGKCLGAWVAPPLPALVAGYGDGTVRVFDVERGRMLRKMQPHAQSVRAVAFFREGTSRPHVVVVGYNISFPQAL